MKQEPLVVLIITVCFLCLVATSAVSAEEVSTARALHGWNYIIILVSTALAVVLTVISFIGYRRDGRKKVLLVTLAFLIFTLKGILIISGDLLLRGVDPYFDLMENLLDFGILACLFFGML